MKKIVVVGGGTMGLDIAHTFARSGHAVVVREISDELAEKSHSRLVAALDKLVARGKMDEAKRAEILGNMTFTTDLAAAADADLVLEAIVENLDVKKSLFQELDGICKADTIFATNTSSISITAIAAATQRADRFIGMHFFNPATVMKLVEVIRGVHTSQETYDAICQLSADIGKEAVEVAEAPGFVVNKILIPMINEAIGLVETGVATPEGIDTAMKLGANHPMGPLALEMCIRDRSRVIMAILKPWPSLPRRFSLGTMQSSKIRSQVEEPRMPIFFSCLPVEKPGKSFSTIDVYKRQPATCTVPPPSSN